MLLNILKIVNHVHSVTGFIAFGELCDEFAGKLGAFIAELNLVMQDLVALFLYKRALFISRAATSAVG
jgi:hypothetical protein